MTLFSPNFNLLASAWLAGQTPAADPADFANVPCQLYINSRADPDMEYGTYWAWSAAIWARIPKASEAAANGGQIFEIPQGSGRYYRKRWVDRIHQGFPNEYLAALLVQCNNVGAEESRFVTP